MDKIQIFKDFPKTEELLKDIPERLLQSCHLIRIETNKMIFNLGHQFNYVYILCRGTCIVLNLDENGDFTKIVFINEGSTLGEMEALTKESMLVFSAKAYTDLDVIKMPKEVFLEWLSTDINACNIMARVLANKLRDASKAMAGVIKTDCIVRLARQLLVYSIGTVKRSRLDLATCCGVSVRTINRCVKRLFDEGYISIQKGKIRISAEQKNKLLQSQYLDVTQ